METEQPYRERFVTLIEPAIARAVRIAALLERRRVRDVVEGALIEHLSRNAPAALELAGSEDGANE